MNYAEMCKSAVESTKPDAAPDNAVAVYYAAYGVNGIPLSVAAMLVNAPPVIEAGFQQLLRFSLTKDHDMWLLIVGGIVLSVIILGW